MNPRKALASVGALSLLGREPINTTIGAGGLIGSLCIEVPLVGATTNGNQCQLHNPRLVRTRSSGRYCGRMNYDARLAACRW